jgi:hypothetical protein
MRKFEVKIDYCKKCQRRSPHLVFIKGQKYQKICCSCSFIEKKMENDNVRAKNQK